MSIVTTTFSHHRDGWAAATRQLNRINIPRGVIFFDWLGDIVREQKIISQPWYGFVHNVVNYPVKEYQSKYANPTNLASLVQQPFFLRNLETCRGLYTLSRHTAEFITRNTGFRTESVWHPIENDKPTFSWTRYQQGSKRIVTIGHWLRRYHSIYALTPSTHVRAILKTNGFDRDYEQMLRYVSNPNDVELINHLYGAEYDELLTCTLVFLDLYDCAACNVILECIIRNTPILVNRLPAVVEYLGEEYPLFYNSLSEASAKLNDPDIIEKGYNYLCEMNKVQFSPNVFYEAMREFLKYEINTFNRSKMFL
jgi:hypothetical protein